MGENRTLVEQVPPHHLEAEQAVLAAMLVDPEVIDLVSDILAADSFYQRAHGLIFQAAMHLHSAGKPVDLITLRDALGSDAKLDEVGGYSYLIDLASSIPTTAHAEAYAKMVADKAMLRQLRGIGLAIATMTTADGTTGEEVHNQAMALLGKVTSQACEASLTATEMAARYLETLEVRETRTQQGRAFVDSPWYDLNQALNLAPGDLALLAARPAVGKTNWALALAAHVAKTQPALFFSLEMSWDRLADRLYMNLADVDGRVLARGTLNDGDWRRVVKAGEAIAGIQLVIDTPPRLTLAGLRRRALKMAAQGHRPALIVVDYLQLMEAPKAERRDLEIALVSRGLKQLAGELGCVVLALSQLSREVKNRTDKRPVLTDLRDSGALEQDADVVLFLHRDDYYAEQEHRKSEKPGTCEVIIAKYRNGAVGTVDLYFNKDRQRYACPEWGGVP